MWKLWSYRTMAFDGSRIVLAQLYVSKLAMGTPGFWAEGPTAGSPSTGERHASLARPRSLRSWPDASRRGLDVVGLVPQFVCSSEAGTRHG